MTYYRIDLPVNRIPEDVDWHRAMSRMIDNLTDQGVLVPVEPCEHGNIDPHMTPIVGDIPKWKWCPGAGIGGSE